MLLSLVVMVGCQSQDEWRVRTRDSRSGEALVGARIGVVYAMTDEMFQPDAPARDRKWTDEAGTVLLDIAEQKSFGLTIVPLNGPPHYVSLAPPDTRGNLFWLPTRRYDGGSSFVEVQMERIDAH